MLIECYDYNLLAAGTLQDYLYGVHQFANASTWWEIDSVITSGGPPDQTNITRITVQLVSDPTKKVRFEPLLSLFGRDTIVMWFSDGGGQDWGDWTGEKFSQACHLDGWISSAASTQTKAFTNSTYGAQNVTSSKGATFVETSDMFSMFVYGRGARASNWQFGVMAGRIVEWMVDGIEPWGLMAGNVQVGGPLSASTVVSGPMLPQWARYGIATTETTVKGSSIRSGNSWLSLSCMGPNRQVFSQKLGDPSGTQYESLSPVIVQANSMKSSNNTGIGLGFLPYVRHYSIAGAPIDTLHDSDFSSSVSWRTQRADPPEVNTSDGLTVDWIMWPWDQRLGGIAATAI